MYRTIVTAAVVTLLATPAAATPYTSFTDVRARATGTSVIRAFPNAAAPIFRLLLEKTPFDTCIVWLEFSKPALQIDHVGQIYKLEHTNRRELVYGPLTDGDGDHVDPDEPSRIMSSFLTNQHWVARGVTSNAALEVVSADVTLNGAGACAAGVSTRFTPSLGYSDVVDHVLQPTVGEMQVRGFPEQDPTFSLVVEFAQAGTTIETEGQNLVTLTEDACILWLQLGSRAQPLHSHGGLDYTSAGRLDLLGSVAEVGGGQLGTGGLPWISRTTGEVFRIVSAAISGPGDGCAASARVQYAPSIPQLYR